MAQKLTATTLEDIEREGGERVEQLKLLDRERTKDALRTKSDALPAPKKRSM